MLKRKGKEKMEKGGCKESGKRGIERRKEKGRRRRKIG